MFQLASSRRIQAPFGLMPEAGVVGAGGGCDPRESREKTQNIYVSSGKSIIGLLSGPHGTNMASQLRILGSAPD